MAGGVVLVADGMVGGVMLVDDGMVCGGGGGGGAPAALVAPCSWPMAWLTA